MLNKNNINIAIVGPDNSGKTSICKHIEEQFDFKYVRSFGLVNQDNMLEAIQYLAGHLLYPERNVFDRFSIIEEPVNGLVLRNQNNMSFMSEEEIKYWLSMIDLMIYCKVPAKVLSDFPEEIEQMDGVKENIFSLRKAYDVFLTKYASSLKSAKRFITFDWTKDAEYKIIDAKIEYFLENRGYK